MDYIFSTLIFPILSYEIFEGVRTHIWTGIVFGFIIHIIFAKKYYQKSASLFSKTMSKEVVPSGLRFS